MRARPVQEWLRVRIITGVSDKSQPPDVVLYVNRKRSDAEKRKKLTSDVRNAAVGTNMYVDEVGVIFDAFVAFLEP